MKKIFAVLLVVMVLAAVFAAPAMARGSAQADLSASVLAQAETPTSDVQLYVIGLAAMAIIYALKLVTTRFPKVKLTRSGISVLIYVVALGLSFAFGGFVLPAFGAFSDPVSFVSAFFGFINALLLAMAPSVSLATLFYNLILKRVLDAGAVRAGLIETPKAATVMRKGRG